MMGSKPRSFTPVDAVTLDDLVPADHFYRHLERTLDLTFVRDLVADCYAATGRPSIDPVVFFKLQLVMFFEGLRSERQLLEVAADRLSVRWYLGYDLDESLPDHSSLTRIRDRHGLETVRRFFDRIIKQCQQAGLVWGQELYLDATQVRANASLDSLVPRFTVDAHLTELFASIATEPAAPAVAAPLSLPVVRSETVSAELEQTNGDRHDWIAAVGQPDRQVRRHAYQRRSDFEASTTDPDAALMAHKAGGLAVGYHDHYVVDGGKARIILSALVTPADVMENQPMLDLLWQARFRWHLHPHQVTGDTTYGTVENIVAVEQQHIHAFMPLPDFDHRTPFYGKDRFTYDPKTDSYVCPQGERLRFRKHKYTERVRIYQADAATCHACTLKAACTTNDHGRQVRRSLGEAELDRVRDYHEREPYQRAMRKRRVWVEPLFGEAKQWHGLQRFRLHGLTKVNGEALLIAAGQNLKRLLHWHGWGRRPCPAGAPGIQWAAATVSRPLATR